MFTNKAVAELKNWASAAQEGNGVLARQHLQSFRHLGASLLASREFQQRCNELYGHEFSPEDADWVCKYLDAIANVEVQQVERYGPSIS